jgi:hypothetical protein
MDELSINTDGWDIVKVMCCGCGVESEIQYAPNTKHWELSEMPCECGSPSHKEITHFSSEISG